MDVGLVVRDHRAIHPDLVCSQAVRCQDATSPREFVAPTRAQTAIMMPRSTRDRWSKLIEGTSADKLRNKPVPISPEMSPIGPTFPACQTSYTPHATHSHQPHRTPAPSTPAT